MEDKGLQFYEYVKSKGVSVPDSFEEFQSGLENPDTAAQFMKYLSTKNIKTPGSVTEFQDVILNNADIPKKDVPEKMSFEELMEKKEKEKEEAERFRNTPLSPLIPNTGKREGEIDFFDEAITDIDKDFIGETESFVVPELKYRFKDYGFTFEETGMTGDYVTVTAHNRESEEFSLENLTSGANSEESLKLKSFLLKNRASEDVEAMKRIEARQAYETKRFINQEQVELATKSLNDDMDILVSEEKDLYNVYQEISTYGEKFEGLTQGDLDDNPELKADYDSYKARVDEFQSMSDVLKNKRGDLIDRRWDLKQSVGAYVNMKEEQGQFGSKIINNILLGIGDFAAQEVDLMTEGLVGFSETGGAGSREYTRLMLEEAYGEESNVLNDFLVNVPKPMRVGSFDKNDTDTDEEIKTIKDHNKSVTKKSKEELEKIKSSVTPEEYNRMEAAVEDKLKKGLKYGKDGRWKGGMLDNLQTGLVELIGSGGLSEEYMKRKEGTVTEALQGTARSLPGMISGLTGGVPGKAMTMVMMASQQSMAVKEEMANDPNFDDVSELERTAIVAPIAIVGGVLESFGVRNLQATKGLMNGLIRRAFTKSAGKQLTAKSFERIIRDDIKSGLTRGALKLTGAGLAEAETGAAQEFAEVGMKKIYNYIKDEEKFETATGMQWIQDIAMAGLQEAIGGFVLGSPGAVVTGLSNTYDEFSNDLPDTVYEAFNIVIGDPNIREGYIASINAQVADGSLTREEADEKIKTFKMAGGIAQSIPSDMRTSEKKQAFKLLYERQVLESSIEGKDKSLTKKEQGQIGEINKKIEALKEKSIKRSTKKEKDFEASNKVIEGINKKISELREKLSDTSITKKEKNSLQKELASLENDLKIEKDKSTETDKQEATDIESFFEGTEGEDGPNFATNSGGKSQVLSDKQEAIVNKIKSKVEKVANSLKSRVPGVRILLHENADEYKRITGKSGGGAYIIEDGKGTIHINLSKARASTLAHEAFHAVFLHKLKTDSNAARAAIAMVKSVEKVLDPNSQLAKDIKAFSALYKDKGEGIQNEEKLAELVGRISSEYKTLSRSSKDKVIDLLKKLANKIGFKFEEDFGKSDQDVIDLLNTLARKFESGEEITEEDVDVIGKDIDSDAEQSTIIRSNKRFQADFTDIESGLTYVYDKNSEEFKRLEKEGYITRDKSINDFNGSFMILHQPDSAFSGTIKKGDTVLVQGKGGVYYPIKFHNKGYFWASTAGAADDLAKSMNKSMDKNGGKIYLALTSAPADKVLSSTNAANGVMELFIALSRDRKLKIRNITSILINAYNDSKFKEGNKKGGKILTINKNTPMAEVISRISTTLGPEMSVFDERKAFSGSVIKGVVESIGSNKENQEAHNRLADIFGEGMMAEDLITKFKPGSKLSVANLTQAVSQMLTEPILREGKSKTQNGLIYAVLEIDGPVESMEAKSKDDHESYPKTIKSTNNTKSTLHLLTDRVKWQNITIDPKTKDTVNKSGKVLSSDKKKAAKGVMVDRHTQIMSPSAGITLYPLEINTSGLPKKPSAREQKQDTPQTREQKITESSEKLSKATNVPDNPPNTKNKYGVITSGKVHLYHSTNGLENLNNIKENGIDFSKQKKVEGLFFSKLNSPYRLNDSFVIIETDVNNIPPDGRTEGQEVALGKLDDYKVVYTSEYSPTDIRTIEFVQKMIKRPNGIENFKKGAARIIKVNKNKPLANLLQEVLNILNESPAPQTREQRTKRLAPNGKRSNLDNVQYDTVRTPAFKKWFGDWENDPKNASKVVDENGEPLVVYHGTDKDFDVFDIEKLGASSGNRGWFGAGFYFTPHKKMAEGYASNAAATLRKLPLTKEERRRYDEWSFNDREEGFDYLPIIEKVQELRDKAPRNVFEVFLNLRNPQYAKVAEGVEQGAFKVDQKSDGTIVDNKPAQDIYEIVVREPNQIKLADGSNATFDPDAPSIREQRTERLAPNGNQSNLSDVQYDAVRTPTFKKWFGDWENDPKNASKVVDENGEPLVVYHGTAAKDIEVFKKGENFRSGGGIYFTNSIESAKTYDRDPTIYAAFLNVKNPRIENANNRKWVDVIGGKAIWDIVKESKSNNYNGVIIKNIVDSGGFSQFLLPPQDNYIAFKPNQIKLADGSNKTFDPDAPSIREDRMVESPSRMTAPQIILEARQNNFSDAAIRDYLIRVRGYSVKQVDEALKFDINAFESLPKAFRTITGGVVAGLRLYNRVKAYRDKITKANNKLKNPQLSESEIKAKVAKKLAELKDSVKYGTKTNKQIDDDVRKFRSKEESNNKKRKTKLTAAQVNDRVRTFREKLQAEKQAKIDLRNKAITNFEKTERKANEKRKPRMSEQEIMDKAIEFLEKQPEYLAERETYTVGSEKEGTKQTKFREGLTVAQASLVSAFQSNVGVRPTKSVAEKLKKARRMLRDRKKGAIDLNKIKNELRHFIRRSLPNDLYKKTEVLKLIKLVTDANEGNIENIFEQVEKRVTEMNNKTLIQKISKMLDLKQYAKKDRNGKIIKGRRIDPETLKRLEGIVANLIDPSMDVDELVKAVEERVDSLQKQIDELNSKEELSVEDMTKIVDLNIAMQYNQSLLLENDNIYKTAALDNVHNSLGEIITFGRAVLQDRINKRHKSYVEQVERAYYDITGNKIDMSQEGAKEELAEMSRGMRNKAKKDRVDRRLRGIFQKLKSSLNGGIQDLSGYMNIISTLPGEMFEGEMQDMVTDTVDASTRMYKGRMLQIKEVLETKLREIYGRGWEKEIQESRESIEETEAILGYQLSRDEIIYLYNQYRDPSNHSNFEAQYGGKYAEKMEKLFEFLTKEDKEFADYQVNELFPSLYEYYNPIYKRIYDAEMPWSMVYAGPLRYDGGTETPFDLLQGTTSFQKSMAPGYAIKRVNNKRKISEESNINNMTSYIQEMEYWAAYAENLRDINKLFQNDDIRNAITSIHGPKLMKLIDDSIAVISKKGGQVSEFDRIVNGTNSLFSITRLALSPVIYLKQLTSAFAYANDIGYRNWVKYSIKNIIEFRKLSKEIMENSIYLKDRYDKSITRTLETYKEENSIFTRPKYFIGDKGISGDDVVSFMMGLVTAGDRHAIIIGGMPNYKLYKDRYMKENPEATEQEAVDYAIIKFEKDTKKAQQSSDLQDKDLTQTGNPIYRSFNMFLTSPKQYLRKELYAIRQIYTKIRQWDRMAGKGTVGQNLRTLTTFHVVLPMIFQYVTSGLPGLLADWEDEDGEDLLRAAIMGNINGLFILGDFFVAAADYAQDKPWAFDFKNLTVYDIMGEIGDSVERYQKLKPGPKKEEAYWTMIATIAQAKTIKKWVENLQELPDSKNVNEAIMRLLNYSEYQISGGKKSKKSAPKSSDKEKSLAQEISEFEGS